MACRTFALPEEICAKQVVPSEAMSFICACVSHITESEDESPAIPVAHAMLDCLQELARKAEPVPQTVLYTAAALYWKLLNPENARLAVKVAQASCNDHL